MTINFKKDMICFKIEQKVARNKESLEILDNLSEENPVLFIMGEEGSTQLIELSAEQCTDVVSTILAILNQDKYKGE